MRHVATKKPSFPDAKTNESLPALTGERWQVFSGDTDHWRVGLYAPADTSLADIDELEEHDCPELFLLTSGQVTLVLAKNGTLKEVQLQPNQPVMVTAPHCGYCPNGPHTGTAFVVERDQFNTVYRSVKSWLERTARK